MLHTSSVATSLPRMASAAQMLPQKLKRKRGALKVIFLLNNNCSCQQSKSKHYLICLFTMFLFWKFDLVVIKIIINILNKLFYNIFFFSPVSVLQSNILCGACSQECHGSPSSDKKGFLWSIPRGSVISA